MRKHPHRLSLHNKTLSTKEQAKKLKKKVYAIVDKANSEFSAERRISRRAATLVVKKSLVNSVGLEYSLREYRALKALSEFINLAHHDKSITASVNQFTNLLPVGHPSSTKKHAMTASAFTHARLRWVLADPRIPFEAKPLVASVLTDAPDSESYIYSLTRLESDPDSTVPLQALIAAFGDGNSSAARSFRARLQRRDRFGRFAYMGGGMRALIERAKGAGIYSFTAEPVAETDDGIVVETPDGVLRKIKTDSAVKNLPGNDSKADLPVQFVPARLELEGSKDGFSPTPARVKTGDPVIKEEDLEVLDMPPGFRKDESYKGPGEKYTDDAYDVIKHDKPSPETRTRIEKATKALDAIDKDLIQDKKGEGGKIWDAERPVYEISRRGAKSPFAFTQSWADTQDKIADDEPKMDFEEGRTQAYIPRRDPNEVEEEKLKDLLQKQQEEQPKQPEQPEPEAPSSVETEQPEQPEQAEGFDFQVPQDSYALNTFDDYEPEGRTDQEAEDYTDDPEVLSEKFTSEELNGALVEALYPSVIDSDETTDIVDSIESDDPDAFPSEDAEEPTAEDLEDIKATDEEPVASAVNAATGYGILSFDGGDELVPAEAIYHALKKQGIDADRQVARIYDDINGDTENMDALTQSRGGVEETDIADVIDEVDTEEEPTEEPWKEDWNLTPEELDGLNQSLKREDQFFETEDFTFFRNSRGFGDFDEEISIFAGQWEPGAERVGRIESDGGIDWENDDQFDMHSEALWKYFDSLGKEEEELPEVPSLIANLSDEDFARFQETKDHREFLPENLIEVLEQSITGGYPDTYFYNFNRDAFSEEDQISLGQDPEKPFVTTNPFEVASMFTTDSLKLGFEEAFYNRKNGTSKFTFLNENVEEVEFDMPFESIRDALQLQGVDTDDMIRDIAAQNNVSTEDLMNNEEYDAWLKQEKEKLEKQKQDIAELEKQQEESVAIDEKAQEEDTPLPSLPPAEPMAVPLMGEVSPKELQPGDVSIQDGFIITQISEPILSRNGVKYKVQGYYPGHKIQDTKMWNETTPIKIYRGIPVPPPGDLPTLSKYGWQVDLRKGWITQAEFDQKMAGYNEDLAKAKSLIQFPDSALDLQSTVLSPKGEGSIAPKPDEIDTPEKIGSTPQARKPFVPTFQGRFAELVREAEGDPEKFKELINKEEFIIFDYETTGLDVDDPNSQPFQLSAIKVKNGEITDRFNVFMKPDAALTEWNAKNSVDADGNPLTQEWIDSQKSRAEGHREFLDWAGANPLLAGYNVGFDEGFLRKNSDEAGLDYAPDGIMDVLGLAKSSLWGAKDRPKKFDAEGNPVMQDYGQGPKQATSNTLQDVSKYFKVELENWHDSRSDVEATKGVFDAALDKSIENKKDSRKLSAFNVDKQMTDYLNKLDSYEKSKTGEVNPDANESESAGVPAEPSTEIINNPSELSSVDDSYDPVTSVPASELQANDIAVRKNDAFVIVAVATDPETGKIILNGYYPGHKIQEKIYNSGTEISVVRGIPEAELPQPGDKEPIERPDKNEIPAELMDRKTQEYKERVSNASRAYTRNPLNNPSLDRTSIINKRTNSNTPEGRTNEWIRNPENTNHMFGISASEIKEGDYVKVSRPEDPVAYVYVTNVESDPSTKKMKIDYTHTITGVKGTLNWNEKFRKGLEVRRPMTEQERASKRPLDFEKDGDSARYISADGKTPIQEGDSVSDIETGNSGNVVDFIKNTPDATPETADYVIADNPSGDTFLFIPDNVESKESNSFKPIPEFFIETGGGVSFDPDKDPLEQLDEAVANDKVFIFSYNGKNRVVEIVKTKDGQASIWTNPRNGNQNLRAKEVLSGEEKNFTLSKMEKYNPELDKGEGAEPDFGFTKEEVKSILEEERDLVSRFESDGMTTSDAQGAAEAEIKKKHGKTSTEALTDISKEEANQIFVELFNKELDSQVEQLPPAAREQFKPTPDQKESEESKFFRPTPGESGDNLTARLAPMTPEESKEFYGDSLNNNPFEDIITKDPLMVQALDVYTAGNEPAHPNFDNWEISAEGYSNITGEDFDDANRGANPEDVVPYSKGQEDLVPPIYYLEYVRNLLEKSGDSPTDQQDRIKKSIKALESYKTSLKDNSLNKLTPENEKLVNDLIGKLQSRLEPEGAIDQDSDFERQRDMIFEQNSPLRDRTEGLIVFPEPDPSDETQKKSSPKFEEIKTKLLKNIEDDLRNGVLPWEKKWTGIGFGMFPYNFLTKKPYRGFMNIFTLMYATQSADYSSNRWIGKKQAEDMGGKLKPGEKGTEILVPIMKTEELLDAEGNVVKDDKGKPKTYQIRVGFGSRVVYNADQFDGLPELKQEERTPIDASEAETEVLRRYKNHPPISFIDMPEFDSPHYDGLVDEIVLPKREQYGDDQLGFLKTLFHELAHSTGAKSRLARPGFDPEKGQFSRPVEEMTAEITAAMVGSFLGLEMDREHTSAYIDNWLNGVNRNPDSLLKALEYAVAAASYIVGDEDAGDEKDSSPRKESANITGDIQKGFPNAGNLKNGMKYEISLEEQDLGTGTQKEMKAIRKLTVSGNTYQNKKELAAAGFTYNGKEKNWFKKYFGNPIPVESLSQEELDNNPDQDLARDLEMFSPNDGGNNATPSAPEPQPDSDNSPETGDSRTPGTPTGGNNLSHEQVFKLYKSTDSLKDKVYKAESVLSIGGGDPIAPKPMMQKRSSFSSYQEYLNAYKEYSKKVTEWAQNENDYVISEIGKKHLALMNLNGNAKPIQNYIDEVVSSPWFIEAFGDGGIIKSPKAMIRQKNAAGVYAIGLKDGKPHNSITIHRQTMKNEPTLLHEIAHYATAISSKEPFEGHGIEFIKNYLFIMSKVAGEDWASLLEERLKKEGINLEK